MTAPTIQLSVRCGTPQESRLLGGHAHIAVIDALVLGLDTGRRAVAGVFRVIFQLSDEPLGQKLTAAGRQRPSPWLAGRRRGVSGPQAGRGSGALYLRSRRPSRGHARVAVLDNDRPAFFAAAGFVGGDLEAVAGPLTWGPNSTTPCEGPEHRAPLWQG